MAMKKDGGLLIETHTNGVLGGIRARVFSSSFVLLNVYLHSGHLWVRRLEVERRSMMMMYACNHETSSTFSITVH